MLLPALSKAGKQGPGFLAASKGSVGSASCQTHQVVIDLLGPISRLLGASRWRILHRFPSGISAALSLPGHQGAVFHNKVGREKGRRRFD